MKANVNKNKTYGDSPGEVAMQESESSIKVITEGTLIGTRHRIWNKSFKKENLGKF